MFRLINADQIFEKMHTFLDATNGTPAPDKVYLIEINPQREYDEAHLPKAISMTDSIIRSEAAIFLPNRAAEIILYGNKSSYPELEKAANDLFNCGYSSIYIYKEGKEDWISKGFGVETSIVPADYERKMLITPQMPKKPETGIEPPFSKVA